MDSLSYLIHPSQIKKNKNLRNVFAFQQVGILTFWLKTVLFSSEDQSSAIHAVNLFLHLFLIDQKFRISLSTSTFAESQVSATVSTTLLQESFEESFLTR